jgi:hypothetical protein
MILISVTVDEMPASCWSCVFKYDDGFVYRCPIMDKEFMAHVRVDEYKKERHPCCPLKDGGF